MARPRKKPSDRRSETVRFTVTPAEHAAIQEAAAQARQSVSSYARTMVLTGRVVVRQTRKLDHESFIQLRRLGVNLHQLLRVANASGEVPKALNPLCLTIEKFVKRHLADGDDR